ncbi:Uncharacterised protein [Klebsiella pneumoniae]|uniref:Uncharacterized protein n=1 Tax=Klebsiella pneumoniae TaxID=573 RepID=A0A2X3KNW9_KLEPN|nr:Uncharacterised protein [Klebsiella pneumoniae]
MMVYFSAQQRQDGKIFLAIFRCLQNETVTNFLYLLKIPIVIYYDKTQILIYCLLSAQMGPGSNIYLNLPPRPDNPLILRYKNAIYRH